MAKSQFASTIGTPPHGAAKCADKNKKMLAMPLTMPLGDANGCA